MRLVVVGRKSQTRLNLYIYLGAHERGERDQVGPPGQVLGQLQRRHVPQDLDHGEGHLRPRPPGPPEGDLHHQVESNRSPVYYYVFYLSIYL